MIVIRQSWLDSVADTSKALWRQRAEDYTPAAELVGTGSALDVSDDTAGSRKPPWRPRELRRGNTELMETCARDALI